MSPILKHYDIKTGFWGQPTATLDWCERNYEVSSFVAEFWNTITNVVMIIAGLRGLYDVHQQGFEKRFHFCFGSLLIVGIGSGMFHMTLLYEMQLLDELPMIYTSCILAYCMYEVQSPPKRENVMLASALTILSVLFTMTHVYHKVPLIFFTLYGVMVIALASLDLYIILKQYSKKLICFYVLGLSIQLLGTFLWIVDNLACDQLEQVREILPKILSPILQLHGWWHIFAGYATYMHIIFCVCQRQIFLKKDCELTLSWMWGFEIQKMEPRQSHSSHQD